MRLTLGRDARNVIPNIQTLFNDDLFAMDWDDTELDMFEEGDKIVVKLKAAGFDEKNIDITLEGSQLIITGNAEQVEETENNKKKYYRKEITHKSFTRSIVLPSQVDPEKIDAEFKNGILIIEMLKSEAEKRRKIQIKS